MSLKNKTHGMSNTRFYKTWTKMKYRITNPNQNYYYRYGGRGITFVKRWGEFINFYEDMFPSYELFIKKNNFLPTLERKNNDGKYSKRNCCWASISQQCKNRSTNNKYKGEILADTARRLGITATTLRSRILRGWTKKKAYNTPKLKGQITEETRLRIKKSQQRRRRKEKQMLNNAKISPSPL